MHGSHAATSTTGTQRTARPASRRISTRAIFGALLITFALIAGVLLARHSSAPPVKRVVVAARAVAPGERITAADLTIDEVPSTDRFDEHRFTDPARLEGAVALAPLAVGDVVQRSAVLTGSSTDPSWEFSFPVDRDRAMNGELKPGEHIDVLATYGTGLDATTIVVARDATLLRSTDAKSAMGSSSSIVIDVSLRTADQVLDVAHAAQVAHVTLVRTTRTDGAPAGRSIATGPLSRSTGAIR